MMRFMLIKYWWN